MEHASETWRLHTVTSGAPEGPVLVLVHSLGSSHVVWDDLLRALDPSIRVVAVDLPGHGSSPCAPLAAGEELSPEQLCRALISTVDDAGIGDFHYGGVSLGGLLGYALADMCGQRMRSLSVMSSAPRNGDLQMWRTRARDIRAQGTESILEVTMQRWFTEDYARGRGSAAVARVRKAYVACEDEGYAQCCEVLGLLDAWPTIPRLALPVLLVSGEQDAFSWEEAENLADQLRVGACPQVDVLSLPGRHMCPMEHAAEVAHTLSAHILHAEQSEER